MRGIVRGRLMAIAERKTRQRAAVEEILAQTDQFRTAAQIHEELRQSGADIGLATVYRTLQKMVGADQLDSIRTDDGETAYRHCSVGHHHHLVCRVCGRTVEVWGPAMETWADQIASEHGFRDIQHQLEIFGTCSDCSEDPTP